MFRITNADIRSSDDCLHLGRGVLQDKTEANRLFFSAGCLGDTQARDALGKVWDDFVNGIEAGEGNVYTMTGIH